ncbi:serine/threonine-protein kinase RsbW [Catalinimonas alkaloidigena]|uniref:Serine/threonine-protein kinase RsbW n=1 Tax=Catalinimonas alkaloidigena TaxID=1075417 RepID=A0A1G9EUS8_9BACT|nr:ATP-binding protein [Catalinimonas alkaloidigena]SDK79831.1 serine/threonine-protein kinase RsbW [Catalinimonas alkaloidigena]
MNPIRLTIPSIIENIRLVESFIENTQRELGISDDIYGNIMIAVTESVNNAIKHGNHNDITKNVNLTLYKDDHQLRFVVQDQGEGFDFDNLPDPTAPENILKPGGRGIFLMKNLSDEVNFNNNGSEVELLFYVD